jgi:hypothetical protein
MDVANGDDALGRADVAGEFTGRRPALCRETLWRRRAADDECNGGGSSRM